MADPFLLLTPFLVLLVLALVRFVGCSELADVDPWPPDRTEPPPAPADLTVQYGDETVTLTWTASPGATAYRIKYSDTSMGPYVDGPDVPTPTSVEVLPYDTTRYYVVHALNESGESGPSNEVSATGSRPLIAVIQTFGVPQNYFSGWLGMQITTGSDPLKIVALGRVSHVKNPPDADVPMAHPHLVKIAGPITPQPQPDPDPDLATADDLTNGIVAVAPLSGVVAGDFRYETLKDAVDLAADSTYFIVSEEVAQTVDPTADEWHDYSQMGVANPEAVLDRAVYQEGTPANVYTLPKNGFGQFYVPVNGLYHPA